MPCLSFTARFSFDETKAINEFSLLLFHARCDLQELHHLLSCLRTVLILIVGLLAPFLVGHVPSHTPNQTLPRVAAVRGRVWCPRCHGENDDTFHFCQWCAASSSVVHDKAETGTLHVNMDAVRTRFAESSRRLPTRPFQRPAVTPRPSYSNSSWCPVTPAVLSVCKRLSHPTSSNSFAGLIHAGRDVGRQSTPYTVQRWALRHLIHVPPWQATAPCALPSTPCGPTTSPSCRCSTNATWALSRIGAITHVRETPHAAL